VWKCLQCLCAGTHHECEWRELDSPRRGLLLEAGARFLERGDVGLVELRDVGDVDPARMQAWTGDLLDARERSSLDRPEGRKVDPEYEKVRAQQRSLKRSQVENDLVGTVLYLSSPESDFMTGQLLNVDGGFHFVG